MTTQTKIILIAGCIVMLMLCSLAVVIAVKGEKGMIKNKFIKGFFFWPDVHGDRVPIVARRYKIMIITFSCTLLVFTFYCAFSLLYKYW